MSGCYLVHVASGQARILCARRSIEVVLADPATPAEVARQIELVQSARLFAESLGLEVDDQYTSYVAWPGDRIATSVVATRPGEVTPAGFYFPIVGRLPYKGFFDRERAEAEATDLRERGLDVCVFPVRAYSTLGWFDDPLTTPMLKDGDAIVVETVIHELVHATAYLGDEADWSEGVANFIGEEGRIAFFTDREGAEAGRRERKRVDEDRQIAAEIAKLRSNVAALYRETDAGPARDADRGAAEATARRDLAALPLITRDAAEIARSAPMNDACLALSATYTADTPRLAEALAAHGGDLRAFVTRMIEAADSPDPRASLLAP